MASTGIIQNPLPVLVSLLDTKYATVASVTLLLWDMVLTLELELRRVWFAPKTLGTTLFILNRYIPPLLFALDLYAQFVKNPSPRICDIPTVGASLKVGYGNGDSLKTIGRKNEANSGVVSSGAGSRWTDSEAHYNVSLPRRS
ncbi:hypothetical protein CVT24_011412 [Panaeolus cyanescens]|uniref:DUF6533 domain-containing protein n=1 Tax=Panaeolus cyanescens TaxID=181874 RepID=A0A409VG70_9AGAR|nr:hypothetical protein CVT24_011412 [Panaeolus cyanescens]